MPAAPSYVSKIEWAEKHIDDLKAEVAAFNARTPYEAVVQAHPADPGRSQLCLRIAEPVSPRILLATGDVVHAARAALDHLACAAVTSVTPQTAFPIWRKVGTGPTPADYKALIGSKLQGAPRAFTDVVAELQPYEGGGDEQLWALDYLDVVDKHRLIIQGLASHEQVVLDLAAMLPPIEGMPLPSLRMGLKPADRFPLTDGYVLFDAPHEVMHKMKPEAVIDLALGEPAFLRGEALVPAVIGLVASARDTLERLAQAL